MNCSRADFRTTGDTIRSLVWLQETEGWRHRRPARELAHYYRATLLNSTAAWLETAGPVKRSRRYHHDKDLVNIAMRDLKELARMNGQNPQHCPRLRPGETVVRRRRFTQPPKDRSSKIRGAKAVAIRQKLEAASYVFKHWLSLAWKKRNARVQKISQYQNPEVKYELKDLYNEMADVLRSKGLKRDEWEYRLREGGLDTHPEDRFVHSSVRH